MGKNGNVTAIFSRRSMMAIANYMIILMTVSITMSVVSMSNASISALTSVVSTNDSTAIMPATTIMTTMMAIVYGVYAVSNWAVNGDSHSNACSDDDNLSMKI